LTAFPDIYLLVWFYCTSVVLCWYYLVIFVASYITVSLVYFFVQFKEHMT